MIRARQRFLATGAYHRISDAVAHVAARAAFTAVEEGGQQVTVLDVGCGEGHHTRRVAAALEAGPSREGPVAAVVAGIDVAKAAIALAARAHPEGWYAVASAADLPVGTGAVDVALNVFGPVMPEELARVIRPGGTAVSVHPGPDHLGALRRLVYTDARPHEVKDPLRAGGEWFAAAGSLRVTFPVVIHGADALADLFAMTPYRWHAPPDIAERLAAEVAAPGGFRVEADVVVSSHRRHRSPGP